jgi:glycosyltransferase involved in cell wall biosynthesis
VSAPVFSVVIPTRDRAGVLSRTLDALEKQRGAPEFEIIVVDDGSADETTSMLTSRTCRRPMRVVSLPCVGPAQARNAGFERCEGEWIAFLGSDTPPAPGWLEGHRSRHLREGDSGVAVIGRTSWHPRLRTTCFLDYINEQGLQFGFALIDDPHDVPFNFFYSSNLTLHRKWLERQRFDPRFPDAAWEDVELGYRLTGAGLRLVYEPSALVWHDHHMDISLFLRRQHRVGRSAIIFRHLHPSLAPFLGLPEKGAPRPPSTSCLALLERIARTFEHRSVTTPWLWRYLSNAHYRRGCIAALQEVGSNGTVLPSGLDPAGT